MLSPKLVSVQLLGVLEARGVCTVDVVWTANRVRLVSTRPRAGRLQVRLSRRLLALDSDAELVQAVADFAQHQPSARGALRSLFARLPPDANPRRSRPRVRTCGEHHDLAEILRDESSAHLGEPADVPITWGRDGGRRPRRSIQLGSYHPGDGLIRIHPLLDHPRVPRWVVGFVVFHELLHHELDIAERRGRRVMHPPEFRRREALHPRFRDAEQWERDVLPHLMAGRL